MARGVPTMARGKLAIAAARAPCGSEKAPSWRAKVPQLCLNVERAYCMNSINSTGGRARPSVARKIDTREAFGHSNMHLP